MIEENKFKCIDTTHIYDDGIGYVKIYDASHANESEEQRIWTVSTLAGIAYGNEEAKNPEALYKRLQELKHESLWEFIRIGMSSTMSELNNSMRAFIKNDNYPIINSSNYDEYNFSGVHNEYIACFRIKVPIFVARQFMRHRSFSYIEMSRRYTKDSKVPFEFWIPKELLNYEDFTREDYAEEAIREYDNLIKYVGLHTQVASRFLPQTTYTEFYCMGEVEGLKNFFGLRLKSDAQAEIREVATAMLQLLAKHQEELYNKVLP